MLSDPVVWDCELIPVGVQEAEEGGGGILASVVSVSAWFISLLERQYNSFRRSLCSAPARTLPEVSLGPSRTPHLGIEPLLLRGVIKLPTQARREHPTAIPGPRAAQVFPTATSPTGAPTRRLLFRNPAPAIPLSAKADRRARTALHPVLTLAPYLQPPSDDATKRASRPVSTADEVHRGNDPATVLIACVYCSRPKSTTEDRSRSDHVDVGIMSRYIA